MCVCVRVCVFACECVRACVRVSTYVSACVCVCVCVRALTTLTCCLSSSLLSAVCGLCVSLFVLRGGQLPDESSALLTEPWSGENATLSPEIHTHTVNDMKLKIKDRKAATALEQHPPTPSTPRGPTCTKCET